jgi:anti-anti-sigma regulatory factor
LWYTRQRIGTVSVVTFTHTELTTDTSVAGVSGTEGRPRLLLDFSAVENLHHDVIARLIALQRNVKMSRGKLKLCGMRPDVHYTLERVRLSTFFDIYPDQKSALGSF